MSVETDVRVRLHRNSVIVPGGCWVWVGSVNRKGYVSFATGSKAAGTRRRTLAHRAAYEEFVGPIPDGAQIDHRCRVRACWCPLHLEPVTCRENLARSDSPSMVNARKTHCKRGHEFTPENTYMSARGHRSCRACGAEHARSYRKVAA